MLRRRDCAREARLVAQELAAAFHGTPQHPVARALAEVAPRFNLAEERGCPRSSTACRWTSITTAIPTSMRCELYCHRVAGVVGLLSAEIFGYQDRRTLEYAADLGMAFQLTNIIRDVGEDARRNRIYLPLDELERHGVSLDDIARSRETDDFRRLMEFQIERAQGYYRDAFAKLPAADRRAQRTGIIMAAIYRTVARRDPPRRLPRADAAHIAHACPQAVDSVVDVDQGLKSWIVNRES